MKKAQFNIMLLVTAAIAFVIFGITSSVGAQVINNIGSKLTQPYNDTTLNITDAGRLASYNATQNANKGIEELTSWADIIAIVIAASIVLGIVGLFMAK